MSMGTVVQLRPSQSVLATVRGGRKPNTAFRSREYLTEAESRHCARLLERPATRSGTSCSSCWLIATHCGFPSWWGLRSSNSILGPPQYISGGQRTAHRASMGCKETSCA